MRKFPSILFRSPWIVAVCLILGACTTAIAQQSPVTISASYKVREGTNRGRLSITADIEFNWHIYSITQPKGGPIPASIKLSNDVTDPSAVKIVGEFEPDRKPHIKAEDPTFGIQTEVHEGQVTWTAPIEFREGVDPTTVDLRINYSGQACDPTGCVQTPAKGVVAEFGGTIGGQIDAFRAEGTHVQFSGWLNKQQIRPGDTVQLVIRAALDPEWHIYEYAEAPSENKTLIPTLIVITRGNGWDFSSATTDEQTIPSKMPEYSLPYHENEVQWTIDIEVPENAPVGEHLLAGQIGFQTCDPKQCDLPQSIKFLGELIVGDSLVEQKTPVEFSAGGEYAEALAALESVNQAEDAGEWRDKPIIAVLGLAFLAGLILNIMPCVLPVIGLKVMSFVEQAGEDGRRVFLLNLVFAAGILSVFMVLAALAAFANQGWGALFESFAFKVAMIGIVFAFGLSFFGVWEIPIPGFVGSGQAAKMADREGPAGAFFKGVLTTLLATPCSGPLLIPAVAWALAQPAWLTFLVFAALGLGMASPYILIGAVPQLVNMLPKPGPWMMTFKQVMGFVMMGTVVFLFNSIGIKYVVPIMALLVAVSFACWWVGRISMGAELLAKLRGWSMGLVFVVVGWLFSFYILIPQHELPWQPFSKVALEQALSEGNTVFIDFTADW